MKKEINIEVGNLDQSARRFIEAWHSGERGEKDQSQELLTFEDLETLLRVLTPKRWALLRFLRRSGPMSIRALTKSLTRDYKNVYTEVKELEGLGMISKMEDGRVRVPWDTVVAEFNLEVA
ncbi:MAG: MarR family transcriptional regulator [Acidobacteriota bacterium]